MRLSKSAVEAVLAVTPGEPAGIGPDLLLEVDTGQLDATLIGIADPTMLEQRAKLLGIRPKLNIIQHVNEAVPDRLNIIPVTCAAPVIPGVLTPENSQYVLDTLEVAVALCERGECSGMVTGPVNKAAINDAGIPFTGHTEWLAERTGTPRVVMMLASGQLRVALATTHLPLREVADAIRHEDLVTILHIIHRDLITKFGIPAPRILVCGLNPHAGESGHLGMEEINIIEPALISAKEDGLIVMGPMPADTAFTPNSLAKADVVLAMYHDQGLPVLKHQGFGEAVNITLGLPIIRTSVDHGTALDLSGSGKAEIGSLLTAIRYASEMSAVMAR
ncbi:MAG: 4-hydroxythreonine-4-phosphate dehydrogenase [Candidatus Azotimanducaceae bacterium]|jgi:4-hydroxythreonine-4-phosphate dehydrogenase